MTGDFALAVHALVYLDHKAATLSSEVLAENICTNPARVRRVMAQLKKAGLIETKEGHVGGYTFLKDPARVTLRDVCEAVETRIVSSAWKPGSVDMDCLVASGMAGIMDNVYAELDALCLQRLEGTTIWDIEERIFGAKARKET